MLAILLKILSVLGIVFLVLFGVLLTVLLLVLFFPVTYRIKGRRDAEGMTVRVGVNWLFGLLRARVVYPKPGKTVIKLLCFTIYDSEKAGSKSLNSEEKNTRKKKGQAAAADDLEQEASTASKQDRQERLTADSGGSFVDDKAFSAEKSRKTEKTSILQRIKQIILKKYEKIKYTIINIYDKIKDILGNLAFYMELLREEDTKALLGYTKMRVFRILKKLRPRRLRADILFGTGSPDTTGYVLGIYGIFSPQIRKPCYVNLTPDFTQAVLQGEFDAAGHVTVFCVLSNGVLMLTDKRLRMLINRIKGHNAARKAA